LELSVARVLARLQSERAALLTHYTTRHPEVIKKDIDIAKSEAVIKFLKSDPSGAERELQLPASVDPVLAELARQVEANGREIEELSRQEARARTDLGQYQGRLNLAPVREQELSGILREHDTFKQQYTELLNRQQQSQLATNLAESRESLQFRLLDPPTLPERPSSPKRVKISLGGLAGGIFLGFVLAFLRDSMDHSFHSEQSLRKRFAVPLVVATPLLLTPNEQRARTWTTVFEWVAGSVMTLAVAAAEFYVYRHS
jgi:hypothetical protein